MNTFVKKLPYFFRLIIAQKTRYLHPGLLHFLSYVPDLNCMTGFQLLCCLYRSLCNIVLVLVRIWSEQKEEQDRYKD